MKTIVSSLMLCLLWISALAQVPQKMSYQAVVRNAAGDLVKGQAVGMKVSILKGSATGSVIFSETYTPAPQTNENGLVSIEIGSGTPVTGTFTGINWADGPYFLKTETDPSGDTDYSISGTSTLLSVPYALYAKDVQNKDDADADPANEIQTLSLTGNNLSLSKDGGMVTIPGDRWGTQVVATDVTLTGNGTVTTPLKIADNGVSSVKIADGTIVSDDLAINSVTAVKIADGSVTNAKLAANAVNSIKIQDGSIGAGDISAGAITTDKMANNAVTVAKLPPGYTSDKYLRGDGTWANPPTGITTETDPTWSGAANETVATGRTGNVGIGTTNPAALLHTVGTGTGGGNVVFVGEWKKYSSSPPGNPPVSGIGTRMMWYPDKAAFRAGYVDGSQWDYNYVGELSVAFGLNTIASAMYAAALGVQNTASGLGSTAMGAGSTASGYYSTTMGQSTIASGDCSTAMGSGSTASAHYTTAMGFGTIASGQYSTAMGLNTIASGYRSTAMGSYNVGGGNAINWIATDPLFEIGNGKYSNERNNALTVLKNGYVGFGTATPSAGLHIKATTWPGSFIYLEANTGGDTGLRFYEGLSDKWHIYNSSAGGGLRIANTAAQIAIFCQQSSSNVGIGTTTPFYKLQVGNAGDGTQARANAWNILSDNRLKKDFTSLKNPLEVIEKINGYYFYWNTGIDKARQLGFSAQEVSKVLPEVVSEGEDRYLSIEYGKMSPLLVEAIKALKAENDRLKAQNGQLQTVVESMECRLSKLERLLESTSDK